MESLLVGPQVREYPRSASVLGLLFTAREDALTAHAARNATLPRFTGSHTLGGVNRTERLVMEGEMGFDVLNAQGVELYAVSTFSAVTRFIHSRCSVANSSSVFPIFLPGSLTFSLGILRMFPSWFCERRGQYSNALLLGKATRHTRVLLNFLHGSMDRSIRRRS